MTWERVRNIAAILGIVNILLLGFVGFLVTRIWEAVNPQPQLSLVCPPETNSHEVMVFGERARNRELIEVYVSPQDGSQMYFNQGTADTVSFDGGAWAKTVKLGNPFGLAHRKVPPLDYDLIATLRNGGDSAVDLSEFPRDGIPFRQWISGQAGIEAVATCRINRQPELALLCSGMPLITSPAPSCCRYNANGHACASGCSPASLNHVGSPVLMEWKRNLPMYIELYRSPPGESVEGFPRVAQSGARINLPSGTYEMKVREYKDHQCISSVWFEVLGGQLD